METQILNWNQLFLDSAQILTYLMIIPIIAALYFRKYWNTPIRCFFWYCLLTLGLNLLEQFILWLSMNHYDFISPFLTFFKIENTFFLQIFFYLKNFLLLGLFYFYIFPLKPYNKYILRLGQSLAIFAIINYLFIEGYHVHGVYNSFLSAVFIGVLPLIYLWYSQLESLRIPLKKNPYLWMSLGLFLPKLLALFLYFAGNAISENDQTLYHQLYTIKNIFEVLGQFLIAIGFGHSYYARFIQTGEG